MSDSADDSKAVTLLLTKGVPSTSHVEPTGRPRFAGHSIPLFGGRGIQSFSLVGGKLEPMHHEALWGLMGFPRELMIEEVDNLTSSPLKPSTRHSAFQDWLKAMGELGYTFNPKATGARGSGE